MQVEDQEPIPGKEAKAYFRKQLPAAVSVSASTPPGS